MHVTLRGARLVDATMDLSRGDITLAGATIQSVDEASSAGGVDVDATGALVVPGFVEVHTHGGGGYNLHTTKVEEVRLYARWAASTGVTAFLVTVVGVPNSMPDEQLRTAVQAVEQYAPDCGAAEPVGIFLEGPYINVKRRGAHPSIWLRLPNEPETEHLLTLTQGHLRLVTLAPELAGGEHMARRLIEAGVTVSIGHTDATYEQTQQAIGFGITHATHCFNAMRPLLHREPGPLAAIVQSEHVFGELIADGVHVHPAMVDMLVRMLGPERTIIVTDAQAGAGIPNSTFEFAGQQTHNCCGAARLDDGTLAGSVLTLDQGLRNILKYTRVSLSEAVGMLTLNPATSVKLAERKALLRAGYDADLLIFDQDLHLQATLCRGEVAFATDAWRERLQGV
ncbi:MAG TPA: N-acetylglucosamine-6-phosphate deacetylase [Ktedonobacteraceae bacterium]|nr:N-acetylglucosamine-6-phosphate deacetylase [Ktedonobacteraceae bacterium]